MQHLRSCISRLLSCWYCDLLDVASSSLRAAAATAFPSSACSRSRRLRYQKSCVSLSGQKILISSFGGTVRSTSAFTRRRMKGRSM